MGSNTPPSLTVLTNAGVSPGDVFLANFGPPNGYGTGPEILSTTGTGIWYHPVPAGTSVTDFRTQTYLGQPVLTWSQSASFGGAPTDYIYDNHYRQIATVKAGDDGAATDLHEFLITPSNTALITATKTTTANLTAIGGRGDQTVTDGIIQEIDSRTGKVLFQWNSAGHVPYGDSHLPLPQKASQAWDWTHINAVHLGPSGNLIIELQHPRGHPGAVRQPARRPGHPAFGSAQTASDGGLSVGWGEAPSISEFSPSGKLMFNAVFNGGSFTYRACLLPCNPAV